jgi:hypothetical protein
MANLFGDTETETEIRRAAQRVERDKSAPRCPHGQQFITLCPICSPPLEKDEAKQCDSLMLALGWRKLSFSQPHKASQTRGISDVRWYPPTWNPHGHKPFWFEAKRHREATRTQKHTREGQSAFQQLVESCGEDYVRGGLKELSAYLRERKIAEVGIR